MNQDIIHLISEFIDPDPILFCRLATVSRDFYDVFSSDWAWRYLNPYGVSTDIKSSFLEDLEMSDLVEMSYYWHNYPNPPYGHRSLFAWLGYFTHTRNLLKLQADEPLIMDEQVLWCAVRINGHCLKFGSPYIPLSRDLVLAAVSWCGGAVRTAPKFCSDAGMFTYPIRSTCMDPLCALNMSPLKNAATSLRSDRALALEAVRLNPYSIEYLSNDLRDDEQIVTEALRYFPINLGMVSKRLRDNRSIVALAVSKGGDLLKFASESLKDDSEIVDIAVKQSCEAIIYASPRLREIELKKRTKSLNAGTQVYFSNEELQKMGDNRDFVLNVCQYDPRALQYASAKLRDDRDVVLATLSRSFDTSHPVYSHVCGYITQFVSERLRKDRQVAMQAVKASGVSLRSLGSFCDDKEIALMAIRTWPEAIIRTPLIEADTPFLREALALNGQVYGLLPPILRTHENLLIAVQQNGRVLKAIDGPIDDRELVLTALRTWSNALSVASKRVYCEILNMQSGDQ